MKFVADGLLELEIGCLQMAYIRFPKAEEIKLSRLIFFEAIYLGERTTQSVCSLSIGNRRL
jgi:hypothetical protein